MRAKQVWFAVVLCLVLALAAGAQTPPPSAPSSQAPSADAKKAEEAKKPEPPKDKPFAEIVKDAQVIKGLFTVYRTEEKVFLEILPEQLDKMFLATLTVDSGIGERGFYAAEMGGAIPVIFHKQGKNIQFILKNTMFTAQEGTPIQRAVARSFSDSILGMTKLESLPHPERKSHLIDLGAILLTDLPMVSYGLEATFRIPYRFDAKNSAFGMIKGFPHNVEMETLAHYATERPPLPPLLAPGAPPPPMPPPPRNLADVRSMLFRLRYGLVEVPQTNYRPRLADDRVGHFFEQIEDYTDDKNYVPSHRYINRWQLEKQDPGAPLSRPKQPIVFWLENTIPAKYRDAVRKGVLMWNKAFEKIGFQDAIEVRQQPDDADWDPADIRYSTIRWFIATDSGFAQGPSLTNPLTGQILDADIRFSESMTRFTRRGSDEELVPLGFTTEEKPHVLSFWGRNRMRNFCDMAEGAVADAGFAYDVLLARGMDPDDPKADEFVRAFLTDVTAHEVGHTLGLRHNFRASTIHSFEQLHDKSVTSTQGLTGSLMDYTPTNLAVNAAKQGEYFHSTLGPYDYWAIEYAYKPAGAAAPEQEVPELRKIASRVADPMVPYGTDEDAGFGANPWDMDPSVNRWDLGSEPLKYYVHRVKLGQEIWKNMESKLQRPGEGYQILRRSFGRAFGQAGLALSLSAKYIGGVYHYRDHVGDPGGRLPYQPVPAAQQKQALELLRTNLFAPAAFQFSPQLLNKLANERFPDWRNFASMQTRFDYPVHAQVLALQRSVLDRLYHPIVLARVLDTEVKVANPFTISALFNGLQESIWAETRSPGDSLNINTYRRSLQREHLKKMMGMVLRGESNPPEDARTMARANLTALRGRLKAALAKPGLKMPAETRAHLEECLARIDEGLKANAQRMAF